jgi:hypothetical protein
MKFIVLRSGNNSATRVFPLALRRSVSQVCGPPLQLMRLRPLFCAVLAILCAQLHAQSTIGIYVNPSNNVGIGTTSPLTTLDVAGMLRLDNPTTQANYFSTLTSRYDSSHPLSLSVENNTGGTASEVLGVYSPGGGGSLNLTLGLHGNVGIGTTSPARRLEVVDNSGSAAQYITQNGPGDLFEVAAGSSEKFRIVNSGNVGIGTASPGALLTLKSDNSTQPFYVFDSSYNVVARITYNGQIILRPNNSVDTVNINPGGSSYFTGGNVGIGTTTPGAKLAITAASSGKADLIRLEASNGSGYGAVGVNNAASPGYMYLSDTTGGTERLVVTTAGNVGIGTISPQYMLDVAGQVHASSFVASSGNNYADFVFKPGYKLEPLSDVEAAIKKEGHLSGIPSEAEAKEHGIDLASMQVKLLQKIEELTLHQIDEEKHQIDQEKRLNEQSKDIEQLRKENAELRKEIAP